MHTAGVGLVQRALVAVLEDDREAHGPCRLYSRIGVGGHISARGRDTGDGQEVQRRLTAERRRSAVQELAQRGGIDGGLGRRPRLWLLVGHEPLQSPETFRKAREQQHSIRDQLLDLVSARLAVQRRDQDDGLLGALGQGDDVVVGLRLLIGVAGRSGVRVGNADDDVDVWVVGQRLQDLAVCGDVVGHAPVVQRVGGRQEFGQDPAQERLRLRLELRKRKCLGISGGFIEDELDLAAGCGDRGQTPAGGRFGALQGDRGLEQLLAAVDAQDAMAAKELVVHAVWRRQRP